MTIASGVAGSGGIFPQRKPDRYIEGAPAESRLPFARTYSNPILAQISTVVIGGSAADGIYSYDVLLPSGSEVTVSFDRQSAETDDQIADALNTAANGLAALNGVLLSGNVTDTNTLTFEHPGVFYAVRNSVSPSGATLVLDDTQDAGGVARALARFVERGATDARGFPTVAPLDADSDEDSIGGILIRPVGSYPGIDPSSTLTPTDPNQPDLLPAPGLGAVAYEGAIAMRNVGSVAAAPGGQVHVVISVAGGQQLGQARADQDGGVAKVITATPTAANDTTYVLTVSFPDNQEFNYTVLSDGSGTATEINDDFRTLMAADAVFTARVVATGTATLILTAQALGEDFTVTDSGPGAWASITDTIEAATNTRALALSFARWVIQTGSNALGPLFVDSL